MRIPVPFLVIVALLWPLGGPVGAQARTGTPRRPNLVMVTFDTTRADHLGAYGHFQTTSRWFDGLAARGTLFERAYAPMAQTLPSHATLFTGLSPREHGVTENHLSLADEATTLAELLQARGYLTAAFVAARVLDAESGLAQGFDVYGEAAPSGGNFRHLDRRADAVTDAALAWLDDVPRNQPFFLWVHYFDAHAPYDAPPPFDAKLPVAVTVLELIERFEHGRWSADDPPGPGLLEAYARRWLAYDREVLFADHEFGRLLRGLEKRRLTERAVLAIAADHGEGLLEHGVSGHGLDVYEELVHVPLLVVAPDGELAGTRVEQPLPLAAVRDLLLRLVLGSEADGLVDERDAWTSLRRSGRLALAPVFVERPHYTEERLAERSQLDGPGPAVPGDLLGVIMGDLKLVRQPGGEVQLFDLAHDADELVDLSAERADDVAALTRLLDGWLERQPVVDAPERVISEERRKALEQLGYGR